MPKYSATPWKNEDGDDPWIREIWDDNFYLVAKLYGIPECKDPGPGRDELEFNARLIQAAPRMYELLKEIALSGPNGKLLLFRTEIESLLNDIEEPA